MLIETETRNMKMAKIKQISLVLCCMFTMLVSSVSACYCAHNEIVPQKEQHCAPQPQSAHKEKAENHSADHHSKKASGESYHETFSGTGINSVDQSDECCCVQPSPKIYAKSEGIKIQKQSAALLTFAPVELKSISQVASVKTIHIAAPFYLSDSFYNLTPGRAPPVL